LPTANADLHRFIEVQIKEKLASSGIGSSEKVRRVLRTHLVKGAASVQAVSDLFGVNRRTLNRRLEAEGTSFSGILSQTRFEVASQLIVDTDMSMSQIAAALDYSEASVFTRAFRRWSGHSPNDWRRLKHRVAS
jgi:AraC-like DNA-binding protein